MSPRSSGRPPALGTRVTGWLVRVTGVLRKVAARIVAKGGDPPVPGWRTS